MLSVLRLSGLAVGIASCGSVAIAQVAPGTPDTDIARRKGTLSEKLNATSGVIHPQDNVDPAIRKDPPATGAMPVVPPPGSPGGSPDVQPK